MEEIPVLIAHRNVLVAHALQALLRQVEDVKVLGMAQTWSDVLSVVSERSQAVVLTDLFVLSRSAAQGTGTNDSVRPRVKFVALVPPSSEDLIVLALRMGVAGFIAKDVQPEALFEGIRGVARGEFFVSPSLANEIAQSLRKTSNRVEKLTTFLSSDPSLLTPREFSVVRLLAAGLSNTEIGAELYLSEATIKANLRRIMRKWGVRDRVQVLIKAVQEGVVEL